MAIHLVEENNQALDIEKNQQNTLWTKTIKHLILKKLTTHLDLDKSVQLGLSRVPDLVVHADIFDIYIYGSVSAGREKWPLNVLFFLKVEPPCDQT